MVAEAGRLLSRPTGFAQGKAKNRKRASLCITSFYEVSRTGDANYVSSFYH
jgi:hypothetical protein